MALDQQWLDQLKDRVTLSSLIGRSIRVQKAGREFKACCPFHNEKSASFTINDEKGFYHCFGCGAHGDAIRWMTDHRGMSFIDGIKELAGEVGMEVPQQSREASDRQQRQKGLIDVTTAAAAAFQRCLAGDMGGKAREYLQSRGITPQIAAKFGFGYAPEAKGWMEGQLSDFTVQLLVEAGMLISVEGKSPYDRFRDRIMIPIKDTRGRVIGFGGRAMGNGSPKYLNSPDTPLFDKGRSLYNFDLAAGMARRTGSLVIVEGCMDAIALDSVGIDQVVAPLGTAITEHQLESAWKVAPCPVLLLDGDSAGKKAALRAAERALPLVGASRTLRIAHLPDGMDPDDFAKKHGKSGVTAILKDAVPLARFLWSTVIDEMPASTPEERSAIKARLAEYARSIQHREISNGYLDEFKGWFDQQFSQPANPYQSKHGYGRKEKPAEEKANLSPGVAALGQMGHRMICKALMSFPALANDMLDELMEMSLPPAENEILNVIINLAADDSSPTSEGVLPLLREAVGSQIVDDIENDRLLIGLNYEHNAKTALRCLCLLQKVEDVIAGGVEGAAAVDAFKHRTDLRKQLAAL